MGCGTLGIFDMDTDDMMKKCEWGLGLGWGWVGRAAVKDSIAKSKNENNDGET